MTKTVTINYLEFGSLDVLRASGYTGYVIFEYNGERRRGYLQDGFPIGDISRVVKLWLKTPGQS